MELIEDAICFVWEASLAVLAACAACVAVGYTIKYLGNICG